MASQETPSLFSLKGAVALVTGGSGTLGTAISQAFAEAGAHVVVASRQIEKCEKVAGAIRGQNRLADARSLDLTSQESVDDAAAWVHQTFGRLDILVNNAVTISVGPFESYTTSEWARAMELNSTGIFRTCKAFAPLMKSTGRGSIINVGSIYGVVAPDFRVYGEHMEMASPPSYAFAKGGLVQLTRYLASCFGRDGIRVNCISPGGVFSPSMPADFVRNYSERTLLGRLADAADVQGAAVFLASNASAYITGQNLLVDGGYTVR